MGTGRALDRKRPGSRCGKIVCLMGATPMFDALRVPPLTSTARDLMISILMVGG